MDISASRAASPDDAPRLLELSNAVDRSWWGDDETEAEEIEQRLRMAGDLGRRSRVIETSTGKVVAYAVSFGSHDDTDVVIEPGLEPALRRQVEDELLGWLVDAGVDHVEAPSQATDLLAAYARHGFSPSSSSFELERSPELPLPAASLPEGVELRPFDPAAHAEAVHRLIYRFWTDVPTHRHRGFEEWQELFLSHSGSGPDRQVVAWRHDEPIGAAICRVYAGDTGWVLQLGVAPEERRNGLGRALLVEAARRLGSVDGVETVGLSVVARNARALGLYLSVGFEITREWVTCRRGRPDNERSPQPSP